MMQTVRVPLRENGYDVMVGEGLIARCGQAVHEACGGGGTCVVVTDSNVGPLLGETVCRSIEAAGANALVVEIPAGENSKSFEQLERICEMMAAGGLDRTSYMVALGGGVVGDLGGFAAAIFARGIPYAQIPTTLLAQVDSSVGGKTGINARIGKNLFGSFHQPSLVVADTGTLSTLPEREFREGLAEIIKHGIIRDAALVSEAVALSRSDLPALVARNVSIKASVVAADEREETGERALLNFGHTIGHAVEKAGGYGRFLHGEAISIGIAAALDLSTRLAGLPKSEAKTALDALGATGLPTRLPDDIDPAAVISATALDKKFRGGSIRFVLTKALGSAFVSSDVDRGDLIEAVRRLRVAY